jgi:cytochrome c oxidase subunit 3
MEVGTIEIKTGNQKKLRRRKKVSGFGGQNGGQNGGGGNGGGNDDNPDSHIEKYEKSAHKSQILTWFLLIVVLMTFGGVISAYIVIATNGVLEWKPFNLPMQVWISTIIILAGSVTYFIAERFIKSEKQPKAKTWLIATTILGAAFISSQILAWFALVRQGIYMQSNPYAGFFYILTALHAIHVIGGIIALGYVVLMTWDRQKAERNIKRCKEISAAVGLYWHFMGGLWIVLFLLLGFWK